jgi:hypothetical protein
MPMSNESCMVRHTHFAESAGREWLRTDCKEIALSGANLVQTMDPR